MRRVLFGAFLAIFLCTTAWADLASYVAKKDASFAWSKIDGSDAQSAAPYADLYLISQTWRGIDWKHRLLVVRPPAAQRSDHALLIISGGSWKDGREREPINKNSGELRLAIGLAAQTGMPIAVLRQVPFQPLFGGMTEDRLIAHTFDQYLNGGDDDWPLLLPMARQFLSMLPKYLHLKPFPCM